jgi:hypothetical protein
VAGRDRMTIEEVVRRVLRAEHGDVIRESVAKVAESTRRTLTRDDEEQSRQDRSSA